MVLNLLGIAVLLAVIGVVRSRVPFLRRLAIPDAILAGLAGLAVGPSLLDIGPFDPEELEIIVYHGFAIVFIAVGLQKPSKGARSGASRSLAVAIPTLTVAQTILGFLCVAGFAALGTELHPGFGFMVMLGFQQGPGQALALGSSWEGAGMVDGGQIGLVFAAFGFLYCCAIGIPLIAVARKLGWTTAPGFDPSDAGAPEPPPEPTPVQRGGTMEPLVAQIVAVGCIYALVYGFLVGITSLFPAGNPIAATMWGFHFIVGALFAILARRLLERFGIAHPLDDAMLARVSVVAVDFTTAAALAAVTLAVLDRWLVPILTMTVLAGAFAFVACMWLARRTFPSRPFEHAIVLFGSTTGTIPTGLALLRALDPELRGPAARNMVLGATAAIPLTAPLMLGVLPFSVGLWPRGFGPAVYIPLGILAAYLLSLGLGWRVLTPARLLRPLRRLWPPLAD